MDVTLEETGRLKRKHTQEIACQNPRHQEQMLSNWVYMFMRKV